MAENSKIKMHNTYYLANIYLAPTNTIPFIHVVCCRCNTSLFLVSAKH